MAATTGQLGLVTPTQGDLSGTWGNTVNNGITEYTNIAIAGTTTLNGDSAVTLVNTTGDASATNIVSTSAQYAIVRITGTTTVGKIVTFGSAGSAPYSKTYLVDNAGSYAVTFKAYGQSGVSIAAGEKTLVFYNGTDIVKVSGTVATAGGSTTQVQYNSSGVLAGSANLTFDGTNLSCTGNITSGGILQALGTVQSSSGADLSLNANGANRDVFVKVNGTTLMTVQGSTANVGIGTSSPAQKLSVNGADASNNVALFTRSSGSNMYFYVDTSANVGFFTGSNASGSGVYANATSNTVQFNTNGSERARIDSSGNFMIGTTTIGAGNRMKVVGNNVVFTPNTAAYNTHTFSTGTADVGSYSIANVATTTVFLNAGGDSYFNGGNLGIGITSPTQKLDVYGNGMKVNNASYIGYLGAGNTFASGAASDFCVRSDNVLSFASNGPYERARISAAGGFSVGTTADPGAGAIYATGNITAYYSSDIKFKENVRDIPDALATVNAIGGKLFDWKDDYIESKGGADGYFVQKADFGVVAQDVQKVFPIAVRTREDGSLAVDYEKLGALAFAALVELTKRVEALESK
jgi:hypothetical protein